MNAGRILVLDDDESVAQFVADALAAVGFDATTVTMPADAIVEAKNSRFRMVVADVNLPGMNGFQVRDRIRQVPRCGNLPFLFMSSADPAVEIEIARSLGPDRLLLKPFKPAELRRAVFALLEPSSAHKGPLPDALSPILERVAEKRESGVMTAVQGTTQKRVFFQNGHIVFAASNDPRDLIGQALLRTGRIQEKDLLEAFSAAGTNDQGAPMLAAALSALRKITPEQTRSIFVGKIRESVLDVYLWFEGAAEYVEGALESDDAPFPVMLDTDEIRKAGERRREKWSRVVQVIPDQSLIFKRVGSQWPEEVLRNPGDKLLVKLIDKGFSMAQMFVELRGQEYAVGVRLATLVMQKIIRMAPPAGFRPMKPVKSDTVPDGQTLEIAEETFTGMRVPKSLDGDDDTAAVVDESDMLRRLKGGGSADPAAPGGAVSPVPEILTRALEEFRDGDLNAARTSFEQVLAREPMNTLAFQRIQELDAAATETARAAGLTDDARIGLAVPPGETEKRDIDANDAFVLNRLAAGDHTIGELVKLCPMTEREVLSVVERYLGLGMLVRRR